MECSGCRLNEILLNQRKKIKVTILATKHPIIIITFIDKENKLISITDENERSSRVLYCSNILTRNVHTIINHKYSEQN